MKKLLMMFTLLIAGSFAVVPASIAGDHGHDSKSAADTKSADTKSSDAKSKDDKSKDDKSHDKH